MADELNPAIVDELTGPIVDEDAEDTKKKDAEMVLRVRSTVNLPDFPAGEERIITGKAKIESAAGFLARGYIVPVVEPGEMSDADLPPAEATRRSQK